VRSSYRAESLLAAAQGKPAEASLQVIA
jgi:hypothetical protein